MRKARWGDRWVRVLGNSLRRADFARCELEDGTPILIPHAELTDHADTKSYAVEIRVCDPHLGPDAEVYAYQAKGEGINDMDAARAVAAQFVLKVEEEQR
jgi:hypothetical protein